MGERDIFIKWEKKNDTILMPIHQIKFRSLHSIALKTYWTIRPNKNHQNPFSKVFN